jgi:hypothetical protein
MKKNKPTALQQKNLREIDDHGGVALVVDAFNLDHLKETLDTL